MILNYVSDVIILAEQELGREMTDVEINEASIELLNRINSISDEEKTAFVTELAEAAGPSMGQADGMSQAPAGGASPVASRPSAGPGGAISDFDPSNYNASEESIEQLFRDVASGMYGEDAVAGSLLSQILADAQGGGGTRTGGIARAGRRRPTDSGGGPGGDGIG